MNHLSVPNFSITAQTIVPWLSELLNNDLQNVFFVILFLFNCLKHTNCPESNSN